MPLRWAMLLLLILLLLLLLGWALPGGRLGGSGPASFSVGAR